MNDTSESGADTEQARREHLSALMDGELDRTAADRCCAQWREQADARSSWHVYHLIGDVLRSDELACGGQRDARLLAAVRGRLTAEPVVFAPGADASRAGTVTGTGAGADVRAAGASKPARPRHRWLLPAAVAGFAAVAGVAVMQRPAAPESGPTLASVADAPAALPRPAPPPQPLMTVASHESAAPTPVPDATATPMSPADHQLIRDVRLDRYLDAHKQFGGSSALGVPSGFLRSATLQAPAR